MVPSSCLTLSSIILFWSTTAAKTWFTPVFCWFTAVAIWRTAELESRTVLARLRNPLRWQAREMDRQRTAEDALLRQLARIPPAQLEARQRRVALQLRLWEGAAHTVGLLLALAPAAVVLASAWRALPRPEQAVPTLLWGYGVMLVAGGASYLYLHVQCSRPLRRLAYVLGEAARMNAELDARRAQRVAAPQQA